MTRGRGPGRLPRKDKTVAVIWECMAGGWTDRKGDRATLRRWHSPMKREVRMVRSRLLSLLRALSATWSRSALVGVLMLVGLPVLAAAQNGTVTGTVTSAATAVPLAGRSVTFCSALNGATSCFGSPNTDSSGNYAVGLAPGTYFAFTSNFNTLGFVNEIYDNIPCPGFCNSTTAVNAGTAIVVTSGGTVTGRNFALDSGGSVTGTVTDAATGAPIQNVSISLRTLVGTANLQAGSAASSATGAFTIQGLPTGVYYAAAAGSGVGYTSEIYDDILCPGPCSATTGVASGAPIAVTIGAPTGGINFALTPGGTISGTVRNQATATPLSGVSVQAYTRIGLTVTFMGSASTNASGVYAIGGLPTGTYQLFTGTNLAVNEIYDNLPCPGSCSTLDAVNTGAPVSVVSGSTTSGKDFQLDPGGAISGSITDAVSALPLPGVSISVYRQTGPTFGVLVSSGTSNASGVFTVGGLPTGSYFALASPVSSYVAEVFGGVHCPFCSFDVVFTGTPIAVTAGGTTSGKNFALDAAGSVSGTVTNSASSSPLANVTVFAFTGGATPRQVGSASTSAAGAFTIGGLPTGTYFVATNAGQYTNEVYDNVSCPGAFCSTTFITTSGTPVGVTGGAASSGINFALAPLATAPGAPFSLSATATGGTVQITWSAPTSGGGATSYVLEAGLSPGTTLGTLPVATTSLSVPGVGPGTYYLRVRAANAFGTGPASAEFTLVVGNGGNATPNPPTNLVAWMSNGRLTMTWTAPVAGQVPGSYVLEAGSAVGLSNLAVVELGTRSFTFDPIPSGFFFLRVRAKAGNLVSAPTPDVMINVGNVPAPPSPPQNFFITLSGSTATLNWSAPAVGTATSYIIEAGTATGLANIGVVNTGSTATTLSVPQVPPGTYYLRVRAANAQGPSPVSNERVLTVP